VVSNTPDPDQFLPVPAPRDDHLRLSYIGLIGYSRGIEVAIRGLRHFINRGGKAQLEIHGTGSAEGYLRELVTQLDLETKVHFRGWLNHTRIPQVISETHVGIIPHRRCTHWDTTIPNKLFDYMAAARPVLVSDAKPIKRIVESTGAGMVFEDNNPADLALRLEALVSADRRAELGASGHRAVIERYNWHQDGGRLTETIRDLFRPSGDTS
jgi:glycosyltransferase involved in cell wall biosynthesis